MWYTPEHTLTHNALINMVIGPRGAGKTYGLKKRAVNNWEKRQEQFVYVRRYDSELKLVRENLFADINRDLGTEIEYKDGHYEMNNVIIGWPIALTKSASIKSASFPNVTLIIFDEFIIDEGQHQRYLTKEVDKFLNLYETIARMRENVRAFLLANSLSFVNPYSLYWNLKNDGRKIVKANDGLVLCEMWEDSDFTKAKKNTKFGRLIAGTEFERMSIQNQFILDSDSFISKKDPKAEYYLGLIVDGRNYGLWSNGEYWFVDYGFDPDNVKISFTTEDHNENTILMKKPRQLERFFKAFQFGKVRFYDLAVKADMIKILRRSYL